MKYFVILALLALVAVTFAQGPDQLPSSEKKEDAKDLDNDNSYVYGYPYGGYGAYGGYGGYGGYGYGYPAYYSYGYPAYGGYGLYY